MPTAIQLLQLLQRSYVQLQHPLCCHLGSTHGLQYSCRHDVSFDSSAASACKPKWLC